MKISRNQLKSVVKECLLELLAEGLSASQDEQDVPEQRMTENLFSSRASNTRIATRPRGPAQFDPKLDTPVRNNQNQRNNLINEAVKASSNGNSTMADILADTAKTTLPSMMAGGDGNSGVGNQPVEQISGTPEQVFGEEAAGRWASLAFADGSK